MSEPTSSSASARSLCLMSTPLTLAITGSAAEAFGSDEESLEQPAAIGNIRSAVMAANTRECRRNAQPGSNLGEFIRIGPGSGRPSAAPDSRVSSPTWQRLRADFDKNVSGNRAVSSRATGLIDKPGTPSYLSPNRPIRPQLPPFSLRDAKSDKDAGGGLLPHSAATDERVRGLPRQRSACRGGFFHRIW